MQVRQRTTTARRLRRDATEAEKRLWYQPRQLGPTRFRRQHPIGRHVVDFACPAAKLAIELDGGQHATRAKADAERSSAIADRGYRVLRFWNSDVMKNMSGVLIVISEALISTPDATSPPLRPRGRRGPG